MFRILNNIVNQNGCNNNSMKPNDDKNRKSTRNDNKLSIDISKFTLGTIVGVIHGPINQNQLNISKSKSKLLSLAACYIAFGFTYFKHPDNWTKETINDILLMGKDLLNNSEENCINNLNEKISEDNLLRSFNLFDNAIEILLTDSQMIGNIESSDLTISKNIYSGLCLAFYSKSKKQKQAYIFRCNHIFLLIWQCLGMYFVFDSNGRTKKCKTDLQNGFASLICIYSLNSVAHLIYSLSDLSKDEFYILTEIKLKTSMKLNNKFNKTKQSNVPLTNLVIISDQFAIIRGTISISNDCFKLSKLDQSVIVCCVAYIYSKIHETISWNSRIIDKCILFGYEIYEELVNFKSSKRFTINDLPTEINLGPYKAAISTEYYQQCGQIKLLNANTSSILNKTELMIELKQFFNGKSCGILKIDNNLYFIIWRQSGMFCFFDPYERDDNGNFICKNISSVTTKPPAACLQLHCTLASLCLKLILNITNCKEIVQFELFELVASIRKIDERQNSENDVSGTNNKMENYINNESIESIFLSEMKYVPVTHKLELSSDNEFISAWVSNKVNEIHDVQEKAEGSDCSDSSFEISDTTDNHTEQEEILSNDNLNTTKLSQEFIQNNDNPNITESLILKWTAVDNISPKNIEQLQQLNINIDEYEQLFKLGFTFDEIVQINECQIDPKFFQILKNRTIKSDMDNNEFLSEYQNIGLNLNETTILINGSITVEQLEECKMLGIDIDDILLVLKYNENLNDYITKRKLGLVDNINILQTINDTNIIEHENSLKNTEDNSLILRKSSTSIDEINLETSTCKLNCVKEEEEIHELKDSNDNDVCSHLNSLNLVDQENIQSGSIALMSNDYKEINDSVGSKISINNEQLQTLTENVSIQKSISINSQYENEDNGSTKHDLSVIQSKDGSLNSYMKLLKLAFMMTDRVLVLDCTGEPNCVAFLQTKNNHSNQSYYYMDEICSVTMIRRIHIEKIGLYLPKYETLSKLVKRICQHVPINTEIQSNDQKLDSFTVATKNNTLPTNEFIRGILKKGLNGINKELNDFLETIKSLKQ